MCPLAEAELAGWRHDWGIDRSHTTVHNKEAKHPAGKEEAITSNGTRAPHLPTVLRIQKHSLIAMTYAEIIIKFFIFRSFWLCAFLRTFYNQKTPMQFTHVPPSDWSTCQNPTAHPNNCSFGNYSKREAWPDSCPSHDSIPVSEGLLPRRYQLSLQWLNAEKGTGQNHFQWDAFSRDCRERWSFE
jgi:hypothetical protein